MNENQLADKIFAALMNEGLIVFEPGSAPRSLIVIRSVLEKNPVPRHSRRGEGAHYSGQIKVLSQLHNDVIEVLRAFGAYSYDNGLTAAQVTLDVNKLRGMQRRALGEEEKHKNVKDATISRALSELQGPGLRIVSCVPAEVRLADRDEMRFENMNEPRWFLTGATTLIPQVEIQ